MRLYNQNFNCKQCGHCCLTLTDAICTSVYEEDVKRWNKEGRKDILAYVDFFVGDIWISPVTHDDVERCPWLRKIPKMNKYKCLIQNTKPKHCRDYPKSFTHAQETGCKGFIK